MKTCAGTEWMEGCEGWKDESLGACSCVQGRGPSSPAEAPGRAQGGGWGWLGMALDRSGLLWTAGTQGTRARLGMASPVPVGTHTRRHTGTDVAVATVCEGRSGLCKCAHPVVSRRTPLISEASRQPHSHGFEAYQLNRDHAYRSFWLHLVRWCLSGGA